MDVQLPFAEDIRQYKFAPLDIIKTATGRLMNRHRFIPSEDLQEAMNDYVDAMDVMNLEGLNDPSVTFAQPDDIFSPLLHRVHQVIRARATAPDENTLPDINPVLVSYSTIPAILEGEEELARLKQVADVHLVPAKAKGRKIGREKPLSGLDVTKLLEERTKAQRIHRDNPVPEFRQMIRSVQREQEIQPLVKQMGDIIKATIQESVADLQYPQAVECLKVLRDECLDLDVFEFYDTFIRELKTFLEGDRRDFWSRVRKEKLGLVLPSEDERSTVTPEDSSKFYYGR